MSAKTLPAAPYAGLRPYSEDDAPFFFGRERVGQILVDNLRAKRLTLVYGASGVGKSSVLRAGVQYQLHRLAQENVELKGTPQFAVAVFQEWRESKDDPIGGLRACVRNAVRRALGDPAVEIASPSTSLAESFQGLARRVGGDLLIILDQFEDYFLVAGQANGEGTFSYELQRLVNRPDLRVNFLLSIREDAYSKLECFKEDISSIFDNSIEIEHLDVEAARSAITGPIKQYNRFYAAGDQQIDIEPELVEEVLSQVRTGYLSMADATHSDITEKTVASGSKATIETPFLQLVMTALWKAEMRQGSRILRGQTLDDLHGAEKIVKTHLEQTLSKLSESEKTLAAGAFSYLVTPSGEKRPYTAFDIASALDLDAGQLTSLLEKLARGNNRVVRSFASPDRKGESAYEIFHDVLARPVLDWWRQYRADQRIKEEKRKANEKLAETKRRAEEEKKLAAATARAEEQAKVARILRWKNRALAMATAAAVILFVIAAWQYWRAEQARHQAVVAGNVHSDVLAKLYQVLLDPNDPTTAGDYMKAALDTLNQKINESDPKARGLTLNDIAGIYPTFANQNLEQTIKTLNQQREDYQRDRVPIGDGITLNNIAGIYREVGTSFSRKQEHDNAQLYYEQAEKGYEDARAILEAALDKDHPDVATSLHDLAYVKFLMGKYADAEPLFDRALRILKGALGSDSTYVADAEVSLANCYNVQGKYSEAQEKYQDVLRIRQKELRSDHPKLASSLYDLGSLYFAQGNYAKAEPLFNDALKIWNEAPAPQRSNAAPSFYGLAAIYREYHRYKEAEEYLEKGEMAQGEFLKTDAYLSVQNYDNNALLYDAQNDPQTEAVFLESYRVKVNAFGEKHPDTAYSAVRLASFYQKRGNREKAEEYFNRARDILEALPSSPDFARTLCGLARIYADQGKSTDAESLFKKALAIQEKSIPHHPDIADTLDSYADLLSKTGRSPAADQMRNRAEKIRLSHSEANPGN